MKTTINILNKLENIIDYILLPCTKSIDWADDANLNGNIIQISFFTFIAIMSIPFAIISFIFIIPYWFIKFIDFKIRSFGLQKVSITDNRKICCIQYNEVTNKYEVLSNDLNNEATFLTEDEAKNHIKSLGFREVLNTSFVNNGICWIE